MPSDQFAEVINRQVGLDPDYANYYADAVSQYQVLLQKYGQPGPAIDALFAQNLPPPGGPGTPVGQYVQNRDGFAGDCDLCCLMK